MGRCSARNKEDNAGLPEVRYYAWSRRSDLPPEPWFWHHKWPDASRSAPPDPRWGHEDVSDPTHDYYDIQLMGGGTLLVPVNRAERVGLRLLTNGVDAIMICLRSPARACPRMPGNGRPSCGHVVRSASRPRWPPVFGNGRTRPQAGRTLTASEKAWLDKSCERLSTEAALVDRIHEASRSGSIPSPDRHEHMRR